MNHNFRLVSLLILTLVLPENMSGKDYLLSSPDEKIRITISVDETVRFSIEDPTGILVEQVSPSMTIGELALGVNPRVLSKKYTSIDQILKPVVPTISSEVRDHFNQLTLRFKGSYALVFRAYNKGVAYRFESSIAGEVFVQSEKMNLSLGSDFTSWFPSEATMLSHNERLYKVQKVGEIASDSFCSLPVLFKSPAGSSVLFTEADLYDYPGMFLQKESSGSFGALFPPVVLEALPLQGSEDRNQLLTKKADYLAETAGTRSWPWRLFMLASEDADLLTNNLVFQLSRPLQLKETDWIKPGLVAWDWWNALNIYGVDFESGINNETYKYYIDFASEFGLEYVILDEGWSRSTTEIMACNPDIDVEELVSYGKEKGVGVILWVLWKPLDDHLSEVLDLYRQWGVQGIKVDFMQRADQYMVNYYERVAKEAGERELLADFHGAFKPSGLMRAFPNVISYEGVKGMENVKWSSDITPLHDLTIPFIRMAAGPMDFTPGAMDNAHEENFMIRFDRPMSMGTRCHQLAMYVIYVSPLQMLCDLPSSYYRELECTQFISQIPTVWDETRVIAAEIADHIVLARRKGENWYIGAMCAGSAQEIELDLSFLSTGEYLAEIMEDGVNAGKVARDYKKRVTKISKGDQLKISLSRGGGWAAILKPQ